jgi:hypothetical protein
MYETSIELLLSEGYKRAALPIIKLHSDLLRKFASDCLNSEAKHDYLIQVATIRTFNPFIDL